MKHAVGAGSFLIASPTLRDPNFARTVVLLCEHGESGSMGLVINRPSEMRLEDAIEGLEDAPTARLYVGGPVQPNAVLVLHRDATVQAARPVADGIVLGGEELELLSLLRAAESTRIRVYSGYAGWGAGQLDEELAEGSWLACAAHAPFVFELDPAAVWAEAVRGLGPKFSYLVDLPLDPRVN
jgi:putative transcriptional regulator